MRILMISWEFPPHVVGGLGKHVTELVPALSAAGDDLYIDVLTPRLTGGATVERVAERVTIYRTELPPIDPNDLFNSVIEGNRKLEAWAQQLAASHPYDLIHIHDWLTASAGIALKHAWKAPLVVTIHATERGRHQSYLPTAMSHQINQMEWQACYEAWRVIVCSGYMAGELSAYFNMPADKISVIPNGVDPAILHNCPPEEVARLRERYAAQGEKLLFFIGRITPEKGLQTLIEAMPSILAANPNVRLLVAGKNSEQMKPRVDDLGLGRQVELLGYISDEQRNCLYCAVDAAVFPSLYEPFGIVALEAMAAGCNVIASDVGGLSEVVHHGINGLTVMANDPQSLAGAVLQLLDDGEKAAYYRTTAKQEIEMLYHWDKIAARTIALYDTVIKARQQTAW